ncbi:hypothetical protein NM208_g4202 [Fusarium decemcellulare]|uniref:Uncharacterized protein n=1 Tax=Fusarium decemcellulare TaxID=57161 RepID=A0ACC1SLN8_9HYPO|nr:hypothetical protein NM208_g4202 [Fusarium decemcellulare]
MEPSPVPLSARAEPIDLLHEKIDSLELDVSDGRSLGEAFVEDTWPMLKDGYEEMLPKLITFCKTHVKVSATIEGRVKSSNSIQKSIERREKHRIDHGKGPYDNIATVFRDVHDLVGVRIVVDFTSHLGVVDQFIEKAFRQEKKPNVFSSNREVGYHWKSWFGAYQTRNHHVSIKPETTGGLQPYCKVIFEVQLTCLSESLYNRLAHSLLYKSSQGSISKKDEMVIDMAHGISLCYSMCLLFFEDSLEDPELIESMKKAAPSPDMNDKDEDPSRLIELMSKKAPADWSLAFAPKRPSFDLDGGTSSQEIKVQNLFASIESLQNSSNSKEIIWDQINTRIKEAIQDAIQSQIRLPEVPEARFDSEDVHSSPRCHEGTRVSILEHIESWVCNAEAPETMFWMFAPAGTGKSTIARTLAIRCESRDMLAAGYFFRRGGEGSYRNGTARLFSTVANQLAKQIPRFQIFLRDSLKPYAPEDIHTKNLVEQFKVLIQKPLSRLNNQETKPKLIIIDALDECEDTPKLGQVIELFASLKESTSMRLCVLFTSRQTHPIRNTFRKLEEVRYPHVSMPLHEKWLDETKKDIRAFLVKEFERIREEQNIKGTWPTPNHVDLVVDRATTPSPLFIYASTLLGFIDNAGGSLNSYSQFGKWIKQCDENTSQLSGIYLPILTDALANDDDDDKDNLMRLLTSIACAVTPLSAKTLTSLLGLDKNHVNHWLRNLHSVLHIPKDDQSPIQIIHKSFSDFLFQEGLPGNTPFRLGFFDSHHQLAKECMNRLRRTDNSRAPLGLLQDIHKPQDLSGNGGGYVVKNLQQCIGDDLSYACNHWAHHWLESQRLDDDAYDGARSFLKEHIMHWIEMMAIMNWEERGLSSVRSLFEKIMHKSQSRLRSQVLGLLADAQNFFVGQHEILSLYPLQTCVSGLTFWPPDSKIRQTSFATQLPFIKYATGKPSQWVPQLSQVVHQDFGESHIVAFAISSNEQVLQQYHSGELILWDAETGTRQRDFSHDDAIVALAFWEDGKSFDSVSLQGRVRVWNAETGQSESLCTLEGFESFWHAAISRRQSLIVASFSSSPEHSQDSLGIWNLQTGKYCGRLKRSQNTPLNIMQITLSPDGTTLAVLTSDSKVHFWDILRGTYEKATDLPELGTQICFSPCGSWLAIAQGGFLMLWHIKTGIYHEGMMSLHINGLVIGMEFFPDGNRLLMMGCRAVTIWDLSGLCKTASTLLSNTTTSTGSELIHKPDLIKAMALSSDHKTLATSSNSHPLLLWDLQPNPRRFLVPTERRLAAEAMAFSPDGTTLAVLAGHQVELWEVHKNLDQTCVHSTWPLPPDLHQADEDSTRLNPREPKIFPDPPEITFSTDLSTRDPVLGMSRGSTKWCMNPETGLCQRKAWHQATIPILVTEGWVGYTGFGALPRKFLLIPRKHQSHPFACAGNRLVMGNLEGEFAMWDFDLEELKKYAKRLLFLSTP